MILRIGNNRQQKNNCELSKSDFHNFQLWKSDFDNSPNIAGFTLIELVLVILLLSIITAISTPLFRRTFSDITLRNAAFDMSKLINYGQEMAIVEKAPYKLNLNFKEKKYWLTRRSLSAEGIIYENIKGRCGKPYFLPEGLELTCGKEEAIFYPDGRSDAVKIEIRDRNNKEGRLLDVKGFGNRIKIEALKK